MNERKKNYIINQIQPEKYEYIIGVLSQLEIPKDYSVFIYGTGKQSKKTYESLKNRKDCELIWSEFILKGFFKILQFLIAGYAGLVRIKENKSIKEIFELLSESSMAGIYIIDKNIEKTFIDEVKNLNSDVFIVNDLIIGNSTNYFIYLVDTDAVDSETGIYEIKSVGKDSFLKELFID